MRRTQLLSLLVILFAAHLTAAQAQAPQDKTGKIQAKSNEAAIRDLYNRWERAFRARDLDAIMEVYAPDDQVVAYDIVGPLQFVGKDAYRKDYEAFLSQYEGPIEVEHRDLRIMASGDVAFLHALERISGTLKNGQKSDVWLRATSGLRKLKGQWLIVHDHVSVPADLDTGKAALDLKP